MSKADTTIGALALAGAGAFLGGPAVGVAIGVIFLGVYGSRKAARSRE